LAKEKKKSEGDIGRQRHLVVLWICQVRDTFYLLPSQQTKLLSSCISYYINSNNGWSFSDTAGEWDAGNLNIYCSFTSSRFNWRHKVKKRKWERQN